MPEQIGVEDNTSEYRELQDIDAYFKSFAWKSNGATYTDLENYLRSKGVTSNRKIKDMFDRGLESGIIYKTDKKKYYYKGLDKPVENDSSEHLPFSRSADDDAPY
jgi:hypothetical protein